MSGRESSDVLAVDLAGVDEGARRLERRLSLHRVVVRLLLLESALLVILGILPIAMPLLRDGQDPQLILARPEVNVVGLSLLVFLGIQRLLGGYRIKTLVSGGQSVQRGLLGTLATFALIVTLAAAGKVTGTYSRFWFFTWMGSSLILLPVLRLLIVGSTRRDLMHGAFVYRALAVGVRCPSLKQSDVTRLSQGLSRSFAPVQLQRLEDIAKLETVVREQRVDEIYISSPWELVPEVLRHVRELEHLSAHIYVLPSDAQLASQLLGARLRDDRLHLHIQDRPIDGWRHAQKRAFDVAIAGLGVVLASPVMLIVALAIKLESRGPALFRQQRLGFNGRKFEVLKFRSMYQDQTDHNAARQTTRGDRRVTWVGRFIRKTSVDELPQLFNVLAGDMSIVGPRPHALKTTAEGQELDQAVSEYAARHRVLPGITGLAQVNGLRGELDSIEKLKDRVRYDIEYIENWSLLLDFEIVLRTVGLVVHDPRAY